MLRCSGKAPLHGGPFVAGDLVCFFRKDKGKSSASGGRWLGPARVLGTEGRSLVWLIHGGVPITASIEALRHATGNEALAKRELELRPSRKRRRDVLEDYGSLDYPFGDDLVGSPTAAGGGLGEPQQLPFFSAEDDELDYSPDDVPAAAGQGADPGTPFGPPPGLEPPLALPPAPGPLALELPPVHGPPDHELPPVPEGDVESEVDTAMEEPDQERNPSAQGSRRTSETPTTTLPPHGGVSDPAVGQARVTSETPTTTLPPQRGSALTSLQRALHNSADRVDGHPLASRTTQATSSREPRTERSRSPTPLTSTRASPQSERRAFSGFLARRVSKKSAAARSKELSIGKADPQRKVKMLAARAQEWSNWVNFHATEIIGASDAQEFLKANPHVDVIPTRWVDTLKSQPWEPDRHKARLVVRGDLERADGVRTDSPTCSQLMLSLTLSLAASRRWILHGGDITAAFLQGEELSRMLVLSLPKDGVEGVEPGSLLIARKPVYGARDAPRGFWKRLHSAMLHYGLFAVPNEAAAYVLRGAGGQVLGLVVCHVDDLLWCGAPEMQDVMGKLQEELRFGALEQGSFSYCGRELTQTPEGIRVTCPNTAAKVRPVHLTQQRRAQKDHPATDSGSILGSLNWVARVCRPDISYELSVLQSIQKKAVVQDLLDCNRLLRDVQESPDVGLFFAYGAVDFDQAAILSITDASYAANFDTGRDGEPLGNRSQSGRMLCLASSEFMETGSGKVYMLDYHSNVIRRVCRSTLQAETLSMVQGYEEAEHLRTVLYGMRYGLDGEWRVAALDHIDIHLVTDCRSLEAHLKQAGTSTTSDKRLAIDMSALRQMIWRCRGELHGDSLYGDGVPDNGTTKATWVETNSMVSDGLTKKMKCIQLLGLMDSGSLVFDLDRTSKRRPTVVQT